MPIIVACPGCKMRLKAPDAAVGRAFICPSCKAKVAVAVAVPAPAAKPAPASAPSAPVPAAPAPTLSPKIKVIEKPLLRPPAAPTRLTVVGEADQTTLPPQSATPPAAPAPVPAPTPSRATPMPRPAPPEEEVFTDFEVVEDPEAMTHLAHHRADEGPLDELEEVPEELDELDEVEPSSPLDLSRLLAHAVVRLTRKPPPGIAYKLASAEGHTLAMAIAVPLPGSNSRIGGPAPIRLEVREGDDEVLRATVQPLRSDVTTIEVMGPGDERLGLLTFDGWGALRQSAMRVERPGRQPLQLVPQPSRRRAILAGPDGRELGELVPGNGAWFFHGGTWEVRFGPGLAGRNEERLLLLCLGLGLELRERQRET